MEKREPIGKLSLDLEELTVHTFETDGAEDAQGTVHGHATLVCTHQFACTWTEGGDTYPNCSALDDSCGATCGGPCGPQTYAMHGCYAE